MLRTLKNKIAIIIATLTLAVPVLIVPLPTYASCSTGIATTVGSGVDQATQQPKGTACGQGGNLQSGVARIAKEVVTIFSIIVGVISVIMIIYAGFRYITSGGESGGITSAKNTLLYAIVGLIIVVLAQLIVHYVLNSANTFGGGTNGTTTGGL